MKRGAMKRMLSAVTALIALSFFTGCATIPHAGPVKGGTDIRADDEGFDTFDYIPSGPSDGATQEQILRGFVRAALSPQDRYQTARSFLAPSFADEWKPEASVTVDSGAGRNYLKIDDATWQVSVSPVAFLDADGDYRQSDVTTPIAQPYKFEKVRGQWRLSSAPDGTIIDASSFGNVFSAHTLYFYDPSGEFLVPDQRWFPSGATTPTRIVKSLLAGPSAWLKGAVMTAFPQGASLGLDSVRVTAGVAQVVLDSAANTADAGQLQRMKVQLQRSLLDTASVQSVALSIDGVEKSISVPASPAIQDPKIDSRPLVLTPEGFGFLAGGSLVPVPGLSEPLVALRPSAVVVSADRSVAAAVNGGGVSSVKQGAATLLDARPGVIAPALDPAGYVWSVPTSEPDRVTAYAPDGASHAVTTSWPDVSEVRAIEMSRDGTRLAALVSSGTETRLVVSAVVRGDKEVPERLGEPLQLGIVDEGSAVSLTWVDELTIAVLARDVDGDTTIRSQVVGGQSHSIAGPKGGDEVIGAGGIPAYWVLTAQGSLQGARGTGWQERAADVLLVATQLGSPR